MKYKKGYTDGVFDLFHEGHLYLLNEASKLCEELIVGVCIDEVSTKFKNKKPLDDIEKRIKNIENTNLAKIVFAQGFENKKEIIEKYNIDVVIKGEEWKENKIYKDLKSKSVDLIFIPRVLDISSTKIRNEDEKNT